jgi:polysaccharide biosynthesis transport protein
VSKIFEALQKTKGDIFDAVLPFLKRQQDEGSGEAEAQGAAAEPIWPGPVQPVAGTQTTGAVPDTLWQSSPPAAQEMPAEPVPSAPSPAHFAAAKPPASKVEAPPTRAAYPVPSPAPIPRHSAGDQADAESDGLLDVWEIFRRRKLLIGSLSLLGLVAGLASSLPKPLLYGARSTIEIQFFNENFLGTGWVDPGSAAYSPTESNVNTHLKVLTSSGMKKDVLARLERETIPASPPAPEGIFYAFRAYMLRRVWRRVPENPVQAMEQGLRMAANTVTARIVPFTRIIELECQSTNPVLAASFLNALSKEFIEQNQTARLKSLQRTSEWMNKQLEELRVKVEKSEQQLQSFTIANRSVLPDPGDNPAIKQARIQQLERDLALVQAERASKKSSFEAASTSPLEAFVLTPEGATLRGLHARLSAFQRELDVFSQTLTAEHYKVKALKAQLADIEAEIQRERQILVTKLGRDLDDAQRRENYMASLYQKELQEARVSPSESAALVDYNLLVRQVDTDRQLYQAVLQKVNSASLVSALPTNNYRVLDPSVTGLQPESLRTWILNTSLGGLSGFLLAAGWCVLRQKSNRRLQVPGDSANLLQLPELGVIPSQQRKGSRKEKSSVIPGMEDEPDDSDPIAWDTRSLMAEAFRSTVASLFGPVRHGHEPRILVVTSPSPREGKSTVAANLALALAETHRRVILVDADLRSPRLHTLFNQVNSWGLSNLMQEQTAVGEYPTEALIRSTKIPGVWLLPSGPPAQNLSGILYSSRLRQLLGRLGQEADLVIVDTPPVLPFADARILGRLADGILLVVRCGNTDRSAALAARRRLTEDGSTLLGVLVNDYDFASDQSYYNATDAEKYYEPRSI